MAGMAGMVLRPSCLRYRYGRYTVDVQNAEETKPHRRVDRGKEEPCRVSMSIRCRVTRQHEHGPTVNVD